MPHFDDVQNKRFFAGSALISAIAWLMDWLIDWLTELIDWWLIDGLIDWLIDGLIDWLMDWLIDWLGMYQAITLYNYIIIYKPIVYTNYHLIGISNWLQK